MTFPNQKYGSPKDYIDAYFAQHSKAVSSVNDQNVAEALAILQQLYESDGNLYVCGNGGSASISNHLACDHGKLLATDTDLLPHVHSLATNIEVITAIANDISYDEIFVHQLRLLAQKGDILMTVSSSGNSENVVRAANWAINNGLKVIALTGFDGGRTAALATVNLHVDGDNYGIIEDVHQSLMHLMGQYLRHARMSLDLIQDRRF